MGEGKKISDMLISNQIIEKNLHDIFNDSIVLDNHFQISSISNSVLRVLNYHENELLGKSINILSAEEEQGLQSKLIKELAGGFFSEKTFKLSTKGKHSIMVGISGFYMGLISDINGYVILKIRNLQEIKKLYEQLEQKNLELDHFLYRSSHDLRGPLATIKGLASLAQMDNDLQNVKSYIEKIQSFSQQLDDTLRNIQYLADSKNFSYENEGLMNFDKVGYNLKNAVAQYAFRDEVDFQFKVENIDYNLYFNETLLMGMLKDFLIYTLALPRISSLKTFHILITCKESNLNINIHQKGFELSRDLANHLSSPDFFCTEVLKDSNLVRFYNAKRFVEKHEGHVSFHVISLHEQQVRFVLPNRIELH